MDKFFVFFSKGEKGLYFSNGKKMFFPDRGFKDAKVGLAEVYVGIGKDKGNYAFVSGKMIEELPINMSELETYCLGKEIHRLFFMNSENEEPIYAFLSLKDGGVILLHQSKNGLEVCFETHDDNNEEMYLAKNLRLALDDWVNTVSGSDLLHKLVCMNAQEVSHDDVLERLIGYGYTWSITNATVYDNKYVFLSDGNILIKVKDDFISADSEVILELRKEKSFEVNDKEVKDFMLSNNIAIGYDHSSVTFKKSIRAFDEVFEVEVFNNKCFRMSHLDTSFKGDVIKSAEHINGVRKQYGKVCKTQQQIAELQKLSPKNYLR